MSIEYTCPHCHSILRVADENAGKRARCPKCNVVNRIPGTPVPTQPTATDSQQFFIESVSGQTFGPVTRGDLDKWVEEGRVSASCLIRPTGQSTGQPASVYYPSLGRPAPASEFPPISSPEKKPFGVQATPKPLAHEETNPYMAPVGGATDSNRVDSAGIRVSQADLGQIFSRSFEVFQRDFGLLLGASVVCGTLSIASNLISNSMEEMHDGGLILLSLFAILILNLILTYLVIGQTRIALKLVRNQRASFNDLFSGGDKFLPIIGFNLLVFIPLCLGFLLLIIPGIFLMLYFWPAYTLIVDRKTGVFESFGVAGDIGGRNLLNSFLLGLASIGIGLAGLILCCFGIFISGAFITVLWATAYLAMSGQIR